MNINDKQFLIERIESILKNFDNCEDILRIRSKLLSNPRAERAEQHDSAFFEMVKEIGGLFLLLNSHLKELKSEKSIVLENKQSLALVDGIINQFIKEI